MSRYLLVIVSLIWLTGCSEPPPPSALQCTSAAQCPSGYHCSPAGVCRGDVHCKADGDCCLGERCEDYTCRPRQACSAAVPCLDPNTACIHGICAPRTCSNDSDCGAGTRCVWGRCQAKLPCGGQCASGTACAVLTDRCVPAQASTCPAGNLPILLNEIARMPEGCGLIQPEVACKPLPAVPEGERGEPGVLAVPNGQLVHVSYDRTYGDVVLARYKSAPPFDFIDVRPLAGVPKDAPVVGAVTGPRGGILAPGPDVGRALAAVASSDGQLHVVARDEAADGVRYLRVDNGVVVQDYMVATAPQLGTAVDLVLSAAGQPLLLAAAPAAPDEKPPRVARLTLFAAQNALPTGPTDWTATELDTEAVPPTAAPCGGPCPNNQVCVDNGGKQVCAATASTCKTCLPGQVCVAGQCKVALVAPAPLDKEPTGRGASLDLLVLANGQVAAAAYSPSAGDLALYRLTTGTWQRTLIARDVVPDKPKDFGRFVRLMEGDGGKLWAACEDGTHGRLLLVRETDAGATVDVIDSGARPDGVHRVGADIAVVRHPYGGMLLAHQDTRRADLLLQRLPKPGAPDLAKLRQTIDTQDIAGFSPTFAQLGSKAWVLAATTQRLTPDGRMRSTVRLRDLIWNGD